MNLHQMVLPATAHPCFHKAAAYLGVLRGLDALSDRHAPRWRRRPPRFGRG